MDAAVKWVQGVQYRYSNATQQRTVAYDKKNQTVQITDSIEAIEALEAQFLYHIAPGVTVLEHDMGWSLLRDEIVVANVYVNSEAPYTMETITGTIGEAPYYTTVYYEGSRQQEGSLLIVNLACLQGENQVDVVIELSPSAEQKDEIPFVDINWDSPSVVQMERYERPYGAYYLRTEVAGNGLSVENTYVVEDAEYAWEIFAEDKKTRIANSSYSKDSSWSCVIEERGTYYVKAWIRTAEGEKLRTFSTPFTVEETKYAYNAEYILAETVGNKLLVENTFIVEGAAYAWEIFTEDKKTRIASSKYSENRNWDCVIEESGTYYIKAWIKTAEEEKQRVFFGPIVIE